MPLLTRLRYLFFRFRVQSEFDQEIADHITRLADRFVARGMTPEQALYAARREFGNPTLLKETRNDMLSFLWLETLWHDLRYGVRVLSKNKAFATAAILTLALGIGANTAIFSVVNAAILRPLPYPNPDRLLVLWGNVKRVRLERRGASYPDYCDWRDRSRSFSGMAAFDDTRLALTGEGASEQLPGEYVSQPYFSLLGVKAALGRTFRPDEDQVPQRDAVAVLSDGAWTRRFGGDPAIIGRAIHLDGRLYTIVGVAPPGFRGLTDQAEVWVPFLMAGSVEAIAERGTRGFRVLARLKPGIPLARAQSEMDLISLDLAHAYPASNEARGVELSPLDREEVGELRTPLLVLLAAVGFVLLIAATNVANLLLARSEIRRHEMAMRIALGAGRGRLLRQLLAESAVLVALGSAVGLLFSRYGIRALMAFTPLRFPSFVQPSVDPGVAWFTALVSCAVTLALGVVPAAQLRTNSFHDALQRGSSRATGGRRTFRDALVVAEVSVSLVLLIGAGLMIRTLQHLATMNPGYDPNHVVQFRVSLPQLQPSGDPSPNQPDAKVVVAAADILRKVSAVPSVEAASIATDAPLTGDNAIFYAAEGQLPMNAQTEPRAYFHRVSRDFFRVLHTPVAAGRAFTEDEIHNNASVAIVTENMVNRFWPGQDPIGKRIKVGGLNSPRPWLTIVGVVKELRYRGLPHNPTADPDLFQVFNQRSRDFCVLVRTSLDPTAMLAAIRTDLTKAEPSLLIYDARTLDDLIGRETASPRFTGWLMSIFAGIAVLLAMVGIYGVMSYSVSRRSREIGLRMALGAARTEVLRLVVANGMTLVLFGMLVGIALALVLTRMMATLIYDVTATDPITFAFAAGLLAMVALAACLLPASRASRLDPAATLRDD